MNSYNRSCFPSHLQYIFIFSFFFELKSTIKKYFCMFSFLWYPLTVSYWFVAPPLKLIDLPGVEKGNLDDSLVRCCQFFIFFFQTFSILLISCNYHVFCNAFFWIRSNTLVFLQSEYAQHNDAILLVVIPAAQAPEVASAKALRIAKEYDGECEFLLS